MDTHAGPSQARIGRWAALVVVALMLVGCAGPAATPVKTLDLASPAASASPTASASPSADLMALAAKAYLAFATKTNTEIAALGSLSPVASLANVTAYYASLAKIDADAITSLQAISFPPRLKDDVENLIRAATALQKVESDIAASVSLAQVTSRNVRLADALAARAKAANTLRAALGLEPIATPPPPPTLAPTARPSGVAVSDPATGMKIGSPYTLESMDAQTTAEFQSRITAALGTLASSFHFGLRWVDQGDQHVALVMVVEVPGAGAVVTSPEFLTQMAASMAKVSTSDVVTSSILGHPVRLVDKVGSPIAMYARGEGVVVVYGVPGATLDTVTAIATSLITLAP